MLKYLGVYFITEQHTQGTPYEQSEDVIEHEETGDTFPLDQIMRADHSELFDGYMSESNTSSIVVKLQADQESFKVWRSY